MKAIELLEEQHREVEELFGKLRDTEAEREKMTLFVELATNLVAHDAIERELFYPACEQKMGLTDILGESLVEHGVIEFSLYQAAQAFGERDFDFKLKVLEEVVSHHVEDEEDELFPKVQEALGASALDELGRAMEARFEQVKEADYRGPLLDNLRQVLDGAIKTKNAPASKRSESRDAGHKHGHKHAH